MDKRTGLIHHPYRPPEGFAAPQAGVYKASTVIFPDVATFRSRDWKSKDGYTYGLHGTPTSFLLEERIATLEGGKQCLLAPSGLAAIALVAQSLLKSGDEVLVPDNVYGPSKDLLRVEFAQWGVTHQVYDPMDAQDLARRITPKTRLVWLEAAGSVTMEFPDLPALIQVCKQAGAIAALDDTWGAGLAFNPFDLGIDVVAHALTKYPSGGGDVLMGAVVTCDEALHLKLKLTHMRFGFGVGMNDVEAVLRSLPSLALRYAAHDRATRQLARWCQGRAEIAQVLHPALPESPGHAHWKALCGEEEGKAAGLFTVIFAECHGRDRVDAFCNALRIFRIGTSWGGPISLVVPYDLTTMRQARSAHLARGIAVRFAVGLEDVADLQADLAQALDAAFVSR